MTFQIRNFIDQDLKILIDLLNEKYKNSYEFVPFNEENLRSWIQEGRLKILIATGTGEVLGSVAYRDGHWGEEIEWLAVSERPNQKIIEKELVMKVEKCVKGATVFTVIDAGSPRINEWIERGYKHEGGLYQMVARLEALESLPKIPEGIILRSLKTEEEKEFVEATNAGFGWERLKVGIIQRWKSESANFSEEWIHVAEADNKIVSIVASRPDMNYNKFFGGKRGYLGPAVTLPEYRGKNLASALTRRAMNSLFKRGVNSVALHTSEQNIPSVSLLQKLGFQVGHHWKFMRKNLSPSKS